MKTLAEKYQLKPVTLNKYAQMSQKGVLRVCRGGRPVVFDRISLASLKLLAGGGTFVSDDALAELLRTEYKATSGRKLGGSTAPPDCSARLHRSSRARWRRIFRRWQSESFWGNERPIGGATYGVLTALNENPNQSSTDTGDTNIWGTLNNAFYNPLSYLLGSFRT